MKKILLFIFIFVCFYTLNVKASGVMFNPVKSNGKYVLEITQDNKKIDYQDAMKKYGLDNYLTIYIDGENKYFYQGIEIPEEKYLVGKSGEEECILPGVHPPLEKGGGPSWSKGFSP